MIRVAVIDDSPLVCRLLTSYLQSDPEIKVVGAAHRGDHAVRLIQSARPHAVTLDLEMPGMNGLDTLERIMRTCPVPVILISGVSRRAANWTMQALEHGAVDFILKYTPGVDTDPDQLRSDVISKVKLASQIKVIRQLGNWEGEPRPKSPRLRPHGPIPAGGFVSNVVVIGSSTGGPVAVRQLLEQIPEGFPAAILIAQHLPAVFTSVLAEQLDRQSAIPVREAKDGDLLEPGVALLAPGDHHLVVRDACSVAITRDPEVHGHRPSIDRTMASAAAVFGSRAIGILLTGMGSDGAEGMRAIRERGGCTYAQDEESSVIFGMPHSAALLGAVQSFGTPSDIGTRLCESMNPMPIILSNG